MKNVIASACLVAISTLSMHHNAHAVSASGIFSKLTPSNVSINPAGALSSQARSIYSFGGGMATAQGKKITLMAVDPPSFNAGCAGISWHFGGFAFISADEIVAMIESIAQAAVGVVIDLAMQTLCPQCQAVMSQMRALANAARAMTADSCRVAQGLGNMLESTGIFGKEKLRTECGSKASREGVVDGMLAAHFDTVCDKLSNITETMNTAGKKVEDWLSKGSKGDETKGKSSVTDEELAAKGNMTDKALSAMGYGDGLSKDILVSALGMIIYPAVQYSDCGPVLRNIPATSSKQIEASGADLSSAGTKAAEVKDDNKVEAGKNLGDASADREASSGKPSAKQSTTPQTDSTKGVLVCPAPPLLADAKEIGLRLVCGFAMQADLDRFAKKWASQVVNGGTGQASVDEFKTYFQKSSVGLMCQLDKIAPGDPATVPMHERPSNENPVIYKCRDGCLYPEVWYLHEALDATEDGVSQEYTGVAWYVMDALYSGVDAVMTGTGPLPNATIGVLAMAEYPLFRIMNLTAVYGYTARQLLEAYSAKIATQHVDSTLNRLLKTGSLPTISTKSAAGFSRQEFYSLREQISALADSVGPLAIEIQNRLAEKQFLVTQITQINKAVQADIISSGLAQNSELAVSIKNQIVNAPKQIKQTDAP